MAGTGRVVAVGANGIGRDFSHAEMDAIEQQLATPMCAVDDNFILFYMLVIAKTRNLDATQLRVLDPVFQNLLLFEDADDATDETARALAGDNLALQRLMVRKTTGRQRALEQIKSVLGDMRVSCFIPLHHAYHWSLLFYHAPNASWYHYDSLAPMHQAYAAQFLALLADAGMISPLQATMAINELEDRRTSARAWQAPRQHSGWECGYFVLMYMHALVTNHLRPLATEQDRLCSAQHFETTFAQWLRGWLKAMRAMTPLDMKSARSY